MVFPRFSRSTFRGSMGASGEDVHHAPAESPKITEAMAGIGDAITQVNHISTVYEYIVGIFKYIYIYINNGDYMGIFILTVYRLLTIYIYIVTIYDIFLGIQWDIYPTIFYTGIPVFDRGNIKSTRSKNFDTY